MFWISLHTREVKDLFFSSSSYTILRFINNLLFLEHEEASVGHVNVFGSPYAHWGSHNDAFKSDHIEYDFSKGM